MLLQRDHLYSSECLVDIPIKDFYRQDNLFIERIFNKYREDIFKILHNKNNSVSSLDNNY